MRVEIKSVILIEIARHGKVEYSNISRFTPKELSDGVDEMLSNGSILMKGGDLSIA